MRPPDCPRDHTYGPWWPSGCEQVIADHQDGFFADGSCAIEFRSCRYCPASQERHVPASPTTTVPDGHALDLNALPEVAHRPGSSSAKTTYRAGSPNHQNDSKENPMVERLQVPGRDDSAGGERR